MFPTPSSVAQLDMYTPMSMDKNLVMSQPVHFHNNTVMDKIHLLASIAAMVKSSAHSLKPVKIPQPLAVIHQPKLLVMTVAMEFSFAKLLAAQHQLNMTQSLEPVMTLALLLKASKDVLTVLANNAVDQLISVLSSMPALLLKIAVMQPLAVSGVQRAMEITIVKLLKTAASSKTKTTTQPLKPVAQLELPSNWPFSHLMEMLLHSLDVVILLMHTAAAQTQPMNTKLMVSVTHHAHVKAVATITVVTNLTTSSTRPSKRCMLTNMPPSIASMLTGMLISTPGGTMVTSPTD